MNRPKKNRIIYLDVLKCLAAFLTVFYHFSYYKLNYGYAEGTVYLPNIERIVMCFAASCVPIFFMVNGTLMFSRERNWKDVYKKAIKIGILILIWSVFEFPSWFFKTLIILYILFPVFQYLYIHKRRMYYLVETLIFIMPFLYNFSLLCLKAMGILKANQLSVTGVFTMYSILYFLLGPQLRKLNLNKAKSIILIILGWALVVVECVVYTNIDHFMYDGVNVAFPTIGALMLSVGIYTLVSKIKWNKIGHYISFVSGEILSIFVLHMMVIRGLESIIGFEKANLVIALGFSILIFGICVCIGKIMKKIPIIKELFVI